MSTVSSPDWGVDAARQRGVLRLVIALGIFDGLVAFVAWATGAPAPAAAVLGLVVASAWVASQGWLALASLGARPLRPHEAPRATNLVNGLSTALGMTPPKIWLTNRGGPNAFVCWRAGPVVCVAQSLVETYTRTELEAVIAHCLVKGHRSRWIGLHLGPALPGLGPRLVPPTGFDDDVRAAALTRYPPALVKAIEKAEPVGDRWAPLAFVGRGPAHRPVSERIDAVLEL